MRTERENERQRVGKACQEKRMSKIREEKKESDETYLHVNRERENKRKEIYFNCVIASLTLELIFFF